MKSLNLYRQMESLYRLRALVDETNRESWIRLSEKWRERAELEIENYLLTNHDAPSETVH